MHIKLSFSVSSAQFGAAKFLAKVHNLTSEALPIAWFSSIDSPTFQPKQPENAEHPIRRLEITAQIGNDPRKKVLIHMDCQKVMQIVDQETWIPIYGVLYFFQGQERIQAYHGIFDPRSGKVNIVDMTQICGPKYPYGYISV